MRTRLIPAIILALLCAAPASADDAQIAAQAPPPLARSPLHPDFLLRQPRGWLSLNGALFVPRAGGDLFGFLTETLTVGRSDFRSKAIGAELGVALTPHLEVMSGIDGGRASVDSEYRHLVTAARAPIPQTTKLTNTNVTLGARYTPLGRGRRLSEFAFVPRRVMPFVGAGLNVGYYSLKQNGQFVDYADNRIFYHSFSSTGWSTGPYLHGGAELQVWRVLFLKVDARYTWMRSTLKTDFVGFDGIDLSGLRTSTGFSVIF